MRPGYVLQLLRRLREQRCGVLADSRYNGYRDDKHNGQEQGVFCDTLRHIVMPKLGEEGVHRKRMTCWHYAGTAWAHRQSRLSLSSIPLRQMPYAPLA